MSSNRFKMSFGNENVLLKSMAINSHLQNAQKIVPGGRLNAPMVDRIHKAKPGCSACGKKVM